MDVFVIKWFVIHSFHYRDTGAVEIIGTQDHDIHVLYKSLETFDPDPSRAYC